MTATRKLLLRPEALADLEGAMGWYESQLPGLGDVFLKRVEERMRAIAESPKVFPAVLESIRRAPVMRFPTASTSRRAIIGSSSSPSSTSSVRPSG